MLNQQLLLTPQKRFESILHVKFSPSSFNPKNMHVSSNFYEESEKMGLHGRSRPRLVISTTKNIHVVGPQQEKLTICNFGRRIQFYWLK